MFWEGVPDPWSSGAKGLISHSAEVSLFPFEGEGVARAERAGGGWGFDKFLEVDALMGVMLQSSVIQRLRVQLSH